MSLATWLALTSLFIAGGMTPGPAVLLVMASALRHGARPAMLPALGIAAANLVWIALAASGALAVAATVPALFTVLKFAGVAFIIWLGAATMLTRRPDAHVEEVTAPKRSALFAKGAGLQIANPNALVFFAFLLPAFFDPARAMAPQAAIVAATVTATELVGLAFYATGAAMLAKRFADPRFARTFHVAAGSLMIVSAVVALWATA